MKSIPLHHVRIGLSVLVIAILFVATYATNQNFLKAPKAESATTDNVSGFAWSENFGWISFNNTSDGSAQAYGVNIDMTNKATGGTGDFSGDAWSENIGWVSFDRAKTGNPPSAPFNGGSGPIAQVDWSTGKVTGWARALSACDAIPCTTTVAGGGWDGWIKLSDDSIGVWAGNGVKISGNKFSGYAWSSSDAAKNTGTGWIDVGPSVGGTFVGVQIAGTSCTVAQVTSWGDVPGFDAMCCTASNTVKCCRCTDWPVSWWWNRSASLYYCYTDLYCAPYRSFKA